MMKNKIRATFPIMALVFVCVSMTGCASLGRKLKAWMGGSSSETGPIAQVTTPRFSEQENIRANSDRQYRRMNRNRFEEEADVKEDAGSLWVMEGQGAYLFSQNQMRMVGDLLNVRIDGTPKTQLQTKTRVIAKLLERLEAPQMRGLASQNAAAGGANGAPAKGEAAEGQGAPPAASGAQAPGGEAAGGENQAARADGPFNVQSVPTRIVEQLKDGSYRVRGMQPFMIGKREYKVIVTGIVRSEDFDDAGIDASKLLDPQFDIVSSRKGASL